MSSLAFLAASPAARVAQLDSAVRAPAGLRGAQAASPLPEVADNSTAAGLVAAPVAAGVAALVAGRSRVAARQRKAKTARADVQSKRYSDINTTSVANPAEECLVEEHLRKPLELFLDTADEEEWDKLLSMGIFYGVTTNPMILAKSNQPCTIENIQRLAKKALSYPGIQEVLFQVWGETAENYEKIGWKIFQLDPEHIGVKLPLTDAGIRAASALKKKGVRICMTGCMSAKQVLTANALHADYISPYLGRMCDSGMDGMHEVVQMYEALKDTPHRTRVFAASIRNVGQMMELARNGLDSFTFNPKVAYELVKVPATDEATATFEQCAKDMGASVDNP